MLTQANLICAHLVDQSTGELLYGGAERYTLELASLLNSQGIKIRILHKARRDFRTKVNGWEVVGLRTPAGAKGTPVLSWKASRMATPDQLNIYMLAETAFPFIKRPAIGIQHGIWWESDYSWWKRAYNKSLQRKLALNFDAYVCVDTNFINWLYAEAPGRCEYAHKLWYVPNFAYSGRSGMLNEPPSQRVPGERPEVLFPRRLEFFRGAVLFYEAMKILWRRGHDCVAVFCGDGSLAGEMKALAEREGTIGNIRFEKRDFSGMEAAYRSADIAVVPSIAREGTSLSCIEAMAFGCPVIVTHVGGLGNLVIPDFNGLCVDLREEDLSLAIERLLISPETRGRLRTNAYATVEAFSLEKWQTRWLNVISSVASGEETHSVFPAHGRTTRLELPAKGRHA